MTTVSYLNQLGNIDNRIKDKYMQIEKWEEMAIGLVSPGLSKDKVQTSRKLDKMSTAMAHLIDSKKEYEKKLEELTELKKTIISQIDSMDGDYDDILSGVHQHGLNFQEIAWNKKVSAKTIKRKYKDAIDLFEKRYGTTYLAI